MTRTAPKSGGLGSLAARAMTAVLLGGIAALFVFGTPALQARVSRSVGAAPINVEFDWPRLAGEGAPATWLSPDIQAGLISLVAGQLRADPDPLSTQALPRVGEVLMETGWFERIQSVSRANGGVVRVSGVWRIPAAAVRHSGVDHLVARGGELLAPTYLAGQSGQKVITGASTPPPSRNGVVACGEVWGKRIGHGELSDVQAGVTLLNLLGTRAWKDQVSGVDVSGYAAHRRLEILTLAGTRIVWGGAPGDQVFGEPSVENKLWRIAELNRRFGRIDGGQQNVDISGAIATIDETAAGRP